MVMNREFLRTTQRSNVRVSIKSAVNHHESKNKAMKYKIKLMFIAFIDVRGIIRFEFFP